MFTCPLLGFLISYFILIITKLQRHDHISPISASYPSWNRCFKALRGMACGYLAKLLNHESPDRSWRCADKAPLAVPRSKLKTKGERAADVTAPAPQGGVIWGTFHCSLFYKKKSLRKFVILSVIYLVCDSICYFNPLILDNQTVINIIAKGFLVGDCRGSVGCFRPSLCGKCSEI